MPTCSERCGKEGEIPLVADEPLYEVVDGRRVEVEPMGAHETWIASALMWFLQTFARPQRLGRAVVEVLFDLPSIGRERRPDVAESARGPPRCPPAARLPARPS